MDSESVICQLGIKKKQRLDDKVIKTGLSNRKVIKNKINLKFHSPSTFYHLSEKNKILTFCS